MDQVEIYIIGRVTLSCVDHTILVANGHRSELQMSIKWPSVHWELGDSFQHMRYDSKKK